MITVTKEDVGYYDTTSGPPKYDPGIRPCLLCGVPWTDEDVRTHSIRGDDNKSLFWRAHRTCAVAATPEEITAVDLAVFAVMEVRLGNQDPKLA